MKKPKKEEDYDKKMHTKLVLNRLKVMENSTFIYTHWPPSSNKFFKKISTYMWFILTHVRPCVSMYKL
jgi:hypothetical protein